MTYSLQHNGFLQFRREKIQLPNWIKGDIRRSFGIFYQGFTQLQSGFQRQFAVFGTVSFFGQRRLQFLSGVNIVTDDWLWRQSSFFAFEELRYVFFPIQRAAVGIYFFFPLERDKDSQGRVELTVVLEKLAFGERLFDRYEFLEKFIRVYGMFSFET